MKKQSRLDVRKYLFSQRTINVSNKLSTDYVHASSVNMFKNRIDMYLIKVDYTENKGKLHLELGPSRYTNVFDESKINRIR